MCKDLTLNGLKPISIMLEDFDESGTLQNSIPIQFTAGQFHLEDPEKFISSSDENITFDCKNIPTLKNIVNLQATNLQTTADSLPNSDRVIDKGIDIYPGGEANFEIFYHGEQSKRFHYEGPTGISCVKINDEINNEKLECHWAPSHDDWHLEETHFCFVAIARVFIYMFNQNAPLFDFVP